MSETTTCVDCGAALALCEHAIRRIVAPVESFLLGRAERAEARGAALREALVRAVDEAHHRDGCRRRHGPRHGGDCDCWKGAALRLLVARDGDRG
jgi:hypothetical protein